MRRLRLAGRCRLGACGAGPKEETSLGKKEVEKGNLGPLVGLWSCPGDAIGVGDGAAFQKASCKLGRCLKSAFMAETRKARGFDEADPSCSVCRILPPWSGGARRSKALERNSRALTRAKDAHHLHHLLLASAFVRLFLGLVLGAQGCACGSGCRLARVMRVMLEMLGDFCPF